MRQTKATPVAPVRKSVVYVVPSVADHALLAYAKILHRVAQKKQQRMQQQGALAHAA